MVMAYQNDNNDKVSAKCFFYLPQDGLADKSRTEKIPYDVWAKQGFINATPGMYIGYEHIVKDFEHINKHADIQLVAYDRYKYDVLKRLMIDDYGYSEDFMSNKFVQFGQGYKDISPGIEIMEEMILNESIIHGNNPVLNMCMANIQIQSDASRNRKFVKPSKFKKIDGAVALLMAVTTLKNSSMYSKPKSYLNDSDLDFA